MCSGKPQEVQRPNSFRIENLKTKLNWIISSKMEWIPRDSMLTPEEAQLILRYLPETTVGTKDKRAYSIPHEDGS